MRYFIAGCLICRAGLFAAPPFARDEARGKLTSEVRLHLGKPALFVNGSPTSTVTFFSRSAEEARPFVQAGFEIGDFSIPFGWTGPEKYDFAETDAVMDAFLKLDPRLLALPRFVITPGDWWCKTYPNEVTARADGKPAVSFHQGPKVRCHPSFASATYRDLARKALRAFLGHVESKYGDRVVGYFPGNGVYGEWLSWNAYWEIAPGSPLPPAIGAEDFSRPAQSAFCDWLRSRYGGRVEDLRKAWGDPRVTFETATVPSEAARKKPSHGMFFDPAGARQAPDYFEFFNGLIADVLMEQCRWTKEFTSRRKVVGVFYGYLWTNKQYLSMNQSGHLGLHKVLHSSNIDFVASPHDYSNRGMGGGDTAQTITDSIALHGKLYFNEVDSETHLKQRQWRWGESLRNPRNFEETTGLLLRDYAYAFTKSFGMWYMELLGGTYNDPAIVGLLSHVRKIDQGQLNTDKRSDPEIAVVVDGDSLRYIGTGEPFLSALLPVQKQWELNYIGAPYDVYLLQDLDYREMPDYKLYLFLNTFAVSEAQRANIHARLSRNHATAVWVYAPGYVGNTPSAANIEALTGIRVREIDSAGELSVRIGNANHPYTKGLGRDFVYGTDVGVAEIRHYFDHRVYLKDPSDPSLERDLPGFQVRPRFAGDDPKATVLGQLVGLNQPGLLVKQQAGWTSVYSAAPILRSALLRNIARAAGCHIYSDAGDIVYANRSFLAVYAPSGGNRVLHLPRRAGVTDLFSEKQIAGPATEFRVSLVPNSTRLFKLN